MATALDFWPGPLFPGYLISGVVAGVVGVADILIRYKDNPWTAVRTVASILYAAANLAFGVAAFWLALVLDIVKVATLTSPDGHLTVELVKSALTVGFGSIFLLRSVAFKLSIGGKDTNVGPSTIVDALLMACDQQIDRTQAAEKDQKVRAMMAGVSFEKAKGFVPAYCLALLQDNEDRAKRLGQLIASISNVQGLDGNADSQRAYLLGNTLINMFGYDVASKVIAGFKAQLGPETLAKADVKRPPAADLAAPDAAAGDAGPRAANGDAAKAPAPGAGGQAGGAVEAKASPGTAAGLAPPASGRSSH